MVRAKRLTFEQLSERLRQYECRYGYSTIDFYRRFQAGDLGDDDDMLMWAGLYHLYLTSLPVRQARRAHVSPHYCGARPPRVAVGEGQAVHESLDDLNVRRGLAPASVEALGDAWDNDVDAEWQSFQGAYPRAIGTRSRAGCRTRWP